MTGVEYAQGTGGRAGVRRQSDPGAPKNHIGPGVQRRTDCGRLPCRLRTLPATTPGPTTSPSSSTLPAWKTRQLITNSTVAAPAIATRSASCCLPAPHNKCLRGPPSLPEAAGFRGRGPTPPKLQCASGQPGPETSKDVERWRAGRTGKHRAEVDHSARVMAPWVGLIPMLATCRSAPTYSKKSSRSFTSTPPPAR